MCNVSISSPRNVSTTGLHRRDTSSGSHAWGNLRQKNFSDKKSFSEYIKACKAIVDDRESRGVIYICIHIYILYV